MENSFSLRDKGILIGLYLSKFDREAVKIFGFKGINEAFNTLGYSIGTKPASIKNYRDEFDPLFPSLRKGRHSRPIREHCKFYFDKFSSLDFLSFTELIKSIVFENYEIEKVFIEQDKSRGVAKRLITGKAAEEYFKANYESVENFKGFALADTTLYACGFDFKLSSGDSFYCVEVKGLGGRSGNVTLTEKEFFMANEYKQQFCLFVAFNFSDRPFHTTVFDPLNSRLNFKKVEREIVQISYSTIL